jgi:hypothetical protein
VRKLHIINSYLKLEENKIYISSFKLIINMNLLILLYFLVAPIVADICNDNSDCNINSFCDYSTSKLTCY